MKNQHETAALQAAKLFVEIWDDFGNDEDGNDKKLHAVAVFVSLIDLDQVCGTLAQPLNYFADDILEDSNPEDLTYCEMVDSIRLAIEQNS